MRALTVVVLPWLVVLSACAAPVEETGDPVAPEPFVPTQYAAYYEGGISGFAPATAILDGEAVEPVFVLALVESGTSAPDATDPSLACQLTFDVVNAAIGSNSGTTRWGLTWGAYLSEHYAGPRGRCEDMDPQQEGDDLALALGLGQIAFGFEPASSDDTLAATLAFPDVAGSSDSYLVTNTLDDGTGPTTSGYTVVYAMADDGTVARDAKGRLTPEPTTGTVTVPFGYVVSIPTVLTTLPR